MRNFDSSATMDIVSSYSLATLGWHAVQAVPLIVWPQVIIGLLNIDAPTPAGLQATGVELYFARSLGFALLTLGMVTVVLTGALPMTSMVETPTDAISPYANAVILLTTLHHGAQAFYCWARYNQTSQNGFLLGFAGTVVLATFGLWCVLFGGDKSRVSSQTGADKRTSNFPFGNPDKKKK
ncbi:hypothetical protein PG989_015195 [Apiospora arundinis]